MLVAGVGGVARTWRRQVWAGKHGRAAKQAYFSVRHEVVVGRWHSRLITRQRCIGRHVIAQVEDCHLSSTSVDWSVGCLARGFRGSTFDRPTTW